MEQAHNRQNDRFWSVNASGPSSVVEHRQKSKLVMVWAGVCASGKTPLVFVEQGVKISKDVYVRDILQAVVLPWAQQHFGDQNGPCNKTLHQPIERKLPRSGARPIFPVSSQQLNGRHTHRTSIQWTTVSGLFLRPGCAQSPITALSR